MNLQKIVARSEYFGNIPLLPASEDHCVDAFKKPRNIDPRPHLALLVVVFAILLSINPVNQHFGGRGPSGVWTRNASPKKFGSVKSSSKTKKEWKVFEI